jgi:hypothetical protein
MPSNPGVPGNERIELEAAASTKGRAIRKQRENEIELKGVWVQVVRQWTHMSSGQD